MPQKRPIALANGLLLFVTDFVIDFTSAVRVNSPFR